MYKYEHIKCETNGTLSMANVNRIRREILLLSLHIINTLVLCELYYSVSTC